MAGGAGRSLDTTGSTARATSNATGRAVLTVMLHLSFQATQWRQMTVCIWRNSPPPPVLGGFVPVPAFRSLIRAASCRRLPSGHSVVGRLRAGPTHGTEVVGGFPIVLKVA